VKPFRKLGAGDFPPEEQVSAVVGGAGGAAQRPQRTGPQVQEQHQSPADEMPGENPAPEGTFHGQGDYSRRGEKQPILDYTVCSWKAQQIEAEKEPVPQSAIAVTREGEHLVSVTDICNACEFQPGCYGLSDAQEEDRLLNKQGSGISPDMPEHLVLEKLARLDLPNEEQVITHMIKSGFSVHAAVTMAPLVSEWRR